MKIFKYIPKKISFYIAGVVVLNLLSSCGIWDPADARKVPANVNDRVEKNLEEAGRGKYNLPIRKLQPNVESHIRNTGLFTSCKR